MTQRQKGGSNDYSEIILTFLHFITQIKLYHWQTHSYSRHKLTDDLHSELSELVDKFVEALIGRQNIEKLNPNYRIELKPNSSIPLLNISDDAGMGYIGGLKTYLESDDFNKKINKFSDLVNLRDEMIQSINKACYLSTLK